MKPLDTSDDVWRIYVDQLTRMSGAEKVESARRLGEKTLEVLEIGIRGRHPDYGEREVHLAVMRRLLGDDLYERVFPDEPRLQL